VGGREHGLSTLVPPPQPSPAEGGGGTTRALSGKPTTKAGEPEKPPPLGYTRNLAVRTSTAYPWSDYRAALDYLRRSTRPSTRIANSLKGFPAVVGPLDRPSAFPAESVAWLKMVRPEDEEAFARSLEQASDSVVVWDPHGPDFYRTFRLERLRTAIEGFYEPEERFGVIEVWRRKPEIAARGGEPRGPDVRKN
jgi:hypothetical protein